MDVVGEILEKTAKEAEKYKPITVEKHLDLEYDLGTLLAVDTNELDGKLLKSKNRNDYLLNLTRDNTQLLINRIWELPTERIEDDIVVKLPMQKTLLPRFKPVPRPKPLTKWQQFAREKGIQKKKKPKLSWDEQLKKWVPLYGFKRSQAEKDKNWVLEVPQNADPMEDQFAKRNDIKAEKIAKNELQRLRNIAKAKNVKVPRMGLTTPDASSAKDLQAAVTIAKASTASLGKFQRKLPQEKEAKNIAAITPGANRKRKLPPVSVEQEKNENLAIAESILNKKPKLNIDKAVSRHVNEEQLVHTEEKKNERPRTGKSAQKSKSAKKPKSGKGQRKGKGGGRKRR